jgi:hypothetical protein
MNNNNNNNNKMSHIDPLLGNDREKMRQWPLLSSSPHAIMEVLLEAVFSM